MRRTPEFSAILRAGALSALGTFIAASHVRASSVLVIPPAAPPGSVAAAGELGDDLLQALRHYPSIQAGLFDPSSAAVNLAVRKRVLLQTEVDAPDDFSSALRIGRVYGADYVLFGTLRPAANGVPLRLRAQLSLADLTTSNAGVITPAPADGSPATDPLAQFSRQIAAAVMRRLAPPPAPTVDLAESHWKEAMRLGSEGQTDQAVVEMRAAMAAAPDNAKYRAGLASLYLNSGQTAVAIGIYQDAATAAPFDVDIRLGLAQALAAHGDTADALAAYQEALKLAPDRADVRLGLGRLLMRTGDNSGALDELEKASKAGDADATDDLVDALMAAGQTGRARKLLTGEIAAAPRRSRPRDQLATLQLKDGTPDAAVRTLLESIHAGATPGVQGLLVGPQAVDESLGAVIVRLPTAPAADVEALRQSADAAAQLIDALPTGEAGAADKRRRAAAASDVLQAIAETQHPMGGQGTTGDVTVLLAQARQLLAGKPPAASASDSPTSGASSPH